ncbi:MAG: exosortase/archaeosortase family protein [Opitutaceae bacterium]|jgi:exosortase/archaeosortase family protein
MMSLWKRWTAVVPESFLAALLLGAGFMGFVAWDQSHWWSTKEDYGFGWLVPAFVAFVVHDRWPRILAALKACAAPDSPRATGGAMAMLKFLTFTALAGGAFLFLLGALYRAGAGASYPGTLAISLGTGVLLLPLLLLNAPEVTVTPGASAPKHSGLMDDARVKLVSLFLFPALVWLVSAPMISIIESNLSLFMLNRVATVVFFVFDILGMAIEQQGNVLKLPLGDVGVAEACSGIRSFTACLFAGSFLSAVFLDKLWKKVALVVTAVLFAFGTNLLRSLFLTAWAYNYGPEAIEGTVHDTAGYAVLGLTVIGLLCMLPLFNLTFVANHDDHHDEQGIAPDKTPKAPAPVDDKIG